MRIQKFLNISDFDKYLIVNEKGHCVDDILDKNNTTKLYGSYSLINVRHKLKLVKNKIEVICVLQISNIEE